jgi:hypothetical protein
MENTNGQDKTVILSSTLTLFWRVFVPVFGTVFVSILALAYLLTDEDEFYVPMLPTLWAKVVIALLWMGWLYFVWRYFLHIYRVDASETHVYVTNYWVTVRYPWSDVARIEQGYRFGRAVVYLHLKANGRFGTKIRFLPGTYFKEWLADHPDVLQQV